MLELKSDFFENQLIILPNLDNIQESDDLYLKDSRFINYLQIYLENFLIDSDDACIYNTFINTIDESFIHFDFTNMKVKIPLKITSFINTCSMKSLIIIPIRFLLIHTQEILDEYDYNNIVNHNIRNELYSAHSNVIIIDNEKQTIELFEPHGYKFLHLTGNLMMINNIIENTIKDNFNFTKNYMFINSASMCLLGGVQFYQNVHDSKAGHCLAWSLLFIILRIMNTKLNLVFETQSEFLHKYLITNYSSIQLNSIIRKFITTVNSIQLKSIEYSYEEYYIKEYINEYVENRIKYISSLYFINISTAFSNNTVYNYVLYEELNSYRFYPKFHEILKQSLLENFSNDDE